MFGFQNIRHFKDDLESWDTPPKTNTSTPAKLKDTMFTIIFYKQALLLDSPCNYLVNERLEMMGT